MKILLQKLKASQTLIRRFATPKNTGLLCVAKLLDRIYFHRGQRLNFTAKIAVKLTRLVASQVGTQYPYCKKCVDFLQGCRLYRQPKRSGKIHSLIYLHIIFIILQQQCSYLKLQPQVLFQELTTLKYRFRTQL